MALYLYRCSACGSKFEEQRRMVDAPLPTSCPNCGSPSTQWAPWPLRFNVGGHGMERFVPAVRPASKPDMTGAARILDCTFENCGTGIHADGAKIIGRRLKFRNNRIAMDVANTALDLDDIDIK